MKQSFRKVLRQLPPKKIAPNPKTNPKPNPNFNRGEFSLGGNCPDIIPEDALCTAQEIKFSIKDFFSKCDQIRRSHLLKRSLMEQTLFI